MLQQDLNDRKKDYIKTKIEPSNLISNKVGIFMQVNDHYEVENPKQNKNCEELMLILERKFDTSLKKSEWIIDQKKQRSERSLKDQTMFQSLIGSISVILLCFLEQIWKNRMMKN